MFAKAIASTVLAAIVGLGWLAMVVPSLAHAQPPMPQGDNFTCPDIAGINYVRDPDDAHAFYLCVDGLERHQFRCPQVTVLVMEIPPKCIPFPHTRA
jgi:phage tail protein X